MAETSQVLPDLAQCLLALPWHTLRALAKANGCSFNGRWTQAQAANALNDALRRPERLVALFPTLSPAAQAALRLLYSAGGSLVYADFTFRYGVLTPYRPWRAANPVKPWETPASPTEELFYNGLIFPFTLGTSRHPMRVLVVPIDYHPTFAALFAPPSAETQSGVATPTTAGNVWTENLLTFLSFLQRESPLPLHGRWLPPSALRTLAALFPPSHRPETPPRSELAWRYLAFLHFLAERAGLVALSAGRLQPTTVAWEWLAASETTRWQQLWDAWSASDSENTALWHRYRLPLWHEETPPQRFREFCAALRERPPRQETIDLYLDALEIHAPELFRPAIAFRAWADLDADARADFRNRQRKALLEICTGPLIWLGITTAAPEFSLTPFGAALLGLPEGAWPNPLPVLGLELAPIEDGWRVQISTTPPREGCGAPLPVRLSLAAFVAPEPATPGAYTLSRLTVQKALHQGHTLTRLLNLLEQAIGPLPPLIHSTLLQWAEELEQITLRQVVLLETRDPTLLQILSQERRIRELLSETLSARAVVVGADRVPVLLRRLEQRGFVPRADLSPESPALSASLTGGAPSEAQTEIAAALRVYAALCDALNTGHAPHTLARDWETQLTSAQHDAAQRRAETLLAAMRQSLPPEGDYHLPTPTGPLLVILEQAIAEQGTVEFTYYTAGREHVTRRRMDPLRLEWRGDVSYCTGYCHLHQAQRIFRVDRMREVVRINTGAKSE